MANKKGQAILRWREAVDRLSKSAAAMTVLARFCASGMILVRRVGQGGPLTMPASALEPASTGMVPVSATVAPLSAGVEPLSTATPASTGSTPLSGGLVPLSAVPASMPPLVGVGQSSSEPRKVPMLIGKLQSPLTLLPLTRPVAVPKGSMKLRSLSVAVPGATPARPVVE